MQKKKNNNKKKINFPGLPPKQRLCLLSLARLIASSFSNQNKLDPQGPIEQHFVR
ncbi:hypothetical protein LguiB_001152 [Lonicera macranthoides]